MNCNLTRREFIRNAVMLAGAGFMGPLWAVMKYDRDAVMRYFRESEEAMNARVKAVIEANRKSDAMLLFVDAEGRACERVHAKIRQTRHDFKHGANLFGLGETKNGEEAAAAYRELFAAAFNLATVPGGRLSFRGFCGTYEVEAVSNGRTVKREFHVGRGCGEEKNCVIVRF